MGTLLYSVVFYFDKASYYMKLTVEQRSRLFEIVKAATKKFDKIRIISSDHPNKSFIYEDDDCVILYFYNLAGIGVTTNDILQISLYDKEHKVSVRFDSGDYMIMKHRHEMDDIIHTAQDNVFSKDLGEDDPSEEIINQILNEY